MQNNNEEKVIAPIVTCEEVRDHLLGLVETQPWSTITALDISREITSSWENGSKSLCSFDVEFTNPDNKKKAYRVRIMPVD